MTLLFLSHPTLLLSFFSSSYQISTTPKKRIRPVHSTLSTIKSMSDNPTGPYSVSIADARLPDTYANGIRVRLFYPTPTALTTTASWFPPSASRFSHEMVVATLRFARVPASYLIGTALSYIANRPLPAGIGGSLLQQDTPIPLMLFSHGLGGCTATYSSTCIEAASQGMFVIAPEHTDGSAVEARLGSQNKVMEYVRYSRSIHGENEDDLRRNQLDTRVNDFEEIIRALRDGVKMIKLNRSQPELLDPEIIKAAVKLDEVRVIGHSFGGATVLKFADKQKEDMKVLDAVCLDPWLKPLGKEALLGLKRIPNRVLFIDQALSGMTSSVKLRELLVVKNGELIDAVKVLGGMHNNASDFPVRLPKTIAVATGMTTAESDPIALIHAQNRAVATFLKGNDEWMHLRKGIQKGEDEFLRLAPLGDARVLPKNEKRTSQSLIPQMTATGVDE